MAKLKLHEVDLKLINTVIEVLSAENKTIKMDITKLLRGRSTEAKFIVKKVDDKYEGELVSLIIYPSYIRRIIRNNTSIVEDSFICPCKDNTLKIKPFIITRKKVHRSIRTRIRIECREAIIEMCKEMTTEDIFKEILNATLQKTLSKKLKKVYPLAFCDIRTIEIKK